MNALQNTMGLAASIALALALFVGTVIAFIFPFVMAAGLAAQNEVLHIAAVWVMGSVGLMGVFFALHR